MEHRKEQEEKINRKMYITFLGSSSRLILWELFKEKQKHLKKAEQHSP